MRRVFWAQAFGLPSAVADMPAVSVSAGEVLPANLCRVSFGGKDTGGTLMALSLPAAGAEVYWAAQEILGWLSFRFARNPCGDSIGLQRLWLRAAPPRGPQEPWLAVCSYVFCTRECSCVPFPVAGGGTLRVFAGSLSEPVPRHAPARACPAAVQGVARRILRAPTRTVPGCQASAMLVLHGRAVVCGHHRLSGFIGCFLVIPRWHLSLHAAGRCQDSSGRFLSKVYLRLPLPEAATDEAPMELPELRLPFRGKVSLHPQGSGAPRGPKALVCESRPQWALDSQGVPAGRPRRSI